MSINERVKYLRKEKLHFTQEAFGERIGLKKATMSAIETGRNILTDANIKSICREFNISEEWLRTGNGKMFLETDNENQLMIWAANVSKDESESFKRRFVSMLMELDESDWESLEKMCLLLHKESQALSPG